MIGQDGIWLECGSDLLAEPDPGPTPFLVADLIVASAIAAVVGTWKVGKTWFLLELAISIATGRPALGRFAVEQGPVILVVEEAGRSALHRRLDALTRGRAITPGEVADLHFAANRRVRLDDPEWQKRLLDAAEEIQPQAVIFDPFVRVKGTGTDENVQKEVALVLDYMRDLRDASGAAVMFAAHTGHGDPGRMRGSSDLEGYWDSKVTLKAKDRGTTTITAEHREAEASPDLQYRLVWDHATGSVRLEPAISEAEERRKAAALAFITENPGETMDAICRAVKGSKQGVRSAVLDLERAGNAHAVRSHGSGTGRNGRTLDLWHPGPEGQIRPFASTGNGPERGHGEEGVRSSVPAFIEGGTGTNPPDGDYSGKVVEILDYTGGAASG